MHSEQLSVEVLNDELHIANRLTSARLLGADAQVETLRLVLALAANDALPKEVSREVGRSAGRLAISLGRTDDVDANWLRAFASEAYEGYDVEVAIAKWSSDQTGAAAH